MNKEPSPKEIRYISFERSFSKLVKNREVLCNEKGALKKDCAKYKVKYQELVNLVAKQGAEVIRDSIDYLTVPEDLLAPFEQAVKSVFEKYSPEFKKIILNGTFEEFSDMIDEFRTRVIEQHYILQKRRDAEMSA